MKCIYIGSFPPPYGGVTIKNNMLYNGLSKLMNCEKVDLSKVKKLDVLHIIIFLKSVLSSNSIFIIGSAGIWRRRLSKLLYFINRKALGKSVLIVMGGKGAEIIAKDINYVKYVSKYKKIYVEANGMKKELENKGLNNVAIFPNCRSLPKYNLEVKGTETDVIKLVYFSQISEEKGADLVFEAANLLDINRVVYEIDFYGHVNDEYKKNFFDNIDKFPNIKYCGIFKADEEDVYKKLNQYDVLLFPTRWKHEGVPGILVESKIAGITSIVSDINFNSEIVTHNVEGLVLEKNSANELASKIEFLFENRDKLKAMKINAQLSSEYYSLDTHLNNIINEIGGA